MKTLILLVLAVIGAHTAVLDAPTRANLIAGSVGARDRILYRGYVNRPAVANAIQSQDVVYRGNRTTTVTAVQASGVGGTQFATARIISGGIGRNNVTVRFQSNRGRGYHYLLSIYGR